MARDKAKKAAYDKARYNPRASKDRHLRRSYGITIKDYDKMFESQGGTCAICGRPETAKGRSLAVDHSHDTGEVRGLLCHACNTSIGKFRENREWLLKAIKYLGGE